MGAGSVPCLASLWLLSYDDVRAAMGTGGFPSLAAMGVATGEGAARVLATYLIGLGAQGVAAFLLTRSASRGFDAAVGRPDGRAEQFGVDGSRESYDPGVGLSDL
jgi:hypothetical protein